MNPLAPVTSTRSPRSTRNSPFGCIAPPSPPPVAPAAATVPTLDAAPGVRQSVVVFRRARRDAPEEAFTSEIAEALRRAPGVLAVERVEPLQLRVTLPGRGPATAFLDNLFRETNGDGDEARARRIARFVRMMTAPPAVPPDWAAARDKLMPALRPVGRRATTQGDDRAACRAFAPFVDRFLAVDHPESMMIVTEAHL